MPVLFVGVSHKMDTRRAELNNPAFKPTVVDTVRSFVNRNLTEGRRVVAINEGVPDHATLVLYLKDMHPSVYITVGNVRLMLRETGSTRETTMAALNESLVSARSEVNASLTSLLSKPNRSSVEEDGISCFGAETVLVEAAATAKGRVILIDEPFNADILYAVWHKILCDDVVERTGHYTDAKVRIDAIVEFLKSFSRAMALRDLALHQEVVTLSEQEDSAFVILRGAAHVHMLRMYEPERFAVTRVIDPSPPVGVISVFLVRCNLVLTDPELFDLATLAHLEQLTVTKLRRQLKNTSSPLPEAAELCHQADLLLLEQHPDEARRLGLTQESFG